MIALSPTNEAEASAFIADAASAHRPLELAGGGSRRGLGRPVQAAATLSSRALTGITLHEPAELVIGARAGTPLADLTAALDAKDQMLAFEPPDWRALTGTADLTPTVGGLVATNGSGPRRIMSGACRDALIGVRFVNGKGEALSSGGRVMKNVTGYDLVKLMAGSHGTLGFVTEATFKVVPKPERTATLVWSGLDEARAVAAMSQGLGSPFEVSAAAFVPQQPGQPSQTLLRLENFAASLVYRIDRLARELQSFGKPDILDNDASLGLWASIRDAAPLHGVDGAIWRISVAPSRSPSFLRAIASETIRHFLDWGGGLVWLATAQTDGAAEVVQNAARAVGGHATLVHAAPMLRSNFAFMPPSSAGLARLTARVREAMDPHSILNPGRMGV